ncbi:MAG: CerR family C-terminal domain-containing protein [Limisphaerales bacterium]
MNSEPSQTKTRQQLLEAAGQVFAEHGYRAATVREICLRAGANVASIHYHFGDKEKLYLEVLRYAQLLDIQANPGLAKADRKISPDEQLKGFIRSLLVKLLSPGSVAWDGKLLAREMVEPSVGMDVVINERVRPMHKHIREILRAFLGAQATEDELREFEFSIVSQCVFYHHCKEVVFRLYPRFKPNGPEIDKLAEHITAFSLAGLQAKAQRK